MIKDIRISDAFCFPDPPSNWKRIPFPSDKKGEYVGCWLWNGLLVMATVGDCSGEQNATRKTKK